MSNNSFELYIKDLVILIKEKAITAKSKVKNNKNKSNIKDYMYNMGYLMAYHDIISIMKNQANAFGIEESKLGLNNINPDVDLL